MSSVFVSGKNLSKLHQLSQVCHGISSHEDQGHLAVNAPIAASDDSYFNQDANTTLSRFPSSQTVIDSQVSRTLNVKPAPDALPSLIDDREVLPHGIRNAFVNIDSDKVPQQANNNVILSSDIDNAKSQVWKQSLNKDNSRIHVEYLTTTPIKLSMSVQQLKKEWEKGQFDSLNTTDADTYKGQSVYLPWKNNERIAPGDWKIFSNHLANKYYQTSDQTNVFADLDKPFNYNVDTQHVDVGIIEERIHSKQFTLPQAQSVWTKGNWDNKLLNKPDNYHAEEVMKLPWSKDKRPDSVHILTWWRFLNELGGYNNP